MSEETKKETKEQEQPEEQEQKVDPKVALFKIPGAPDQTQIELWKTEFKEVFVTPFTEQEMFIFRPIAREEYVEFQSQASSPDPERRLDNFSYEEAVLDLCVLFPTKVNWKKTKAGIISTLFEQIMQNSYFMPAQMASMLVMKL